MISCQRVLHLWVRGRRPPIYVAAAVVATHTTSRRASVHLADMALLLLSVLSPGLRSLIALELTSSIEKVL